MNKNEKTNNFQVFVDDNFHYMEEDERYLGGEFDTYEEAIAFCKKIVDEFLVKSRKPEMNANELYNYYLDFGEDPFVRSNNPGIDIHSKEFKQYSSWNYALKKSIDMCDKIGVTAITDKLLNAIWFAAEKHKNQRRKGVEGTPYINHPITVAKLLTDVGLVYDADIIQAAILHDTIEDTETTAEELLEHFGKEVTNYVVEMTDDKTLPKPERKRLQVENASHKSYGARHIKICDKICNITDVTNNPPGHWDLQRRKEYLDWAEKVVTALDEVNPNLKQLFEQRLNEGRKKLNDVSSE